MRFLVGFLSILKPGPYICLLGLLFHFLHKFEYFLFLFLLEPILGPKAKEQGIEYQRCNKG